MKLSWQNRPSRLLAPLRPSPASQPPWAPFVPPHSPHTHIHPGRTAHLSHTYSLPSVAQPTLPSRIPALYPPPLHPSLPTSIPAGPTKIELLLSLRAMAFRPSLDHSHVPTSSLASPRQPLLPKMHLPRAIPHRALRQVLPPKPPLRTYRYPCFIVGRSHGAARQVLRVPRALMVVRPIVVFAKAMVMPRTPSRPPQVVAWVVCRGSAASRALMVANQAPCSRMSAAALRSIWEVILV